MLDPVSLPSAAAAQTTKLGRASWVNILKFAIPSAIGLYLFIIPIRHDGVYTIPVGYFSRLIQSLLAGILPGILVGITIFSAIAAVAARLFKPRIVTTSPFLTQLLLVRPLWLGCRIVGAVVVTMTFWQIGIEAIWSDKTGGLLLNQLLPILFSVFFLAGLLLPLLLNFGLLEFFGTLTTRFMRPIFLLPGRSAIDCLASWIGDGTIGVMLTSKQYEEGFYTGREAAVIGTTFSIVSITFCIVVASYLKLDHLLMHFYATVVFVGFVNAIVCPRIPPLSRKADTMYEKITAAQGAAQTDESIPAGHTPLTWGVQKALKKADTNTSFTSFFKEGVQNVIDMWIGVIPIVVAMGTTALLLAEFTPLFRWLGAPFVPILEVLHIPEATEAAQTIMIGFADMFLPAVLGASIKSELTRFVIACLSVSQLIYMSEVGGLLLGSKIPVSFKELVLIFLQRTLISLPIIAGVGHLIGLV